MDNDEFTRFVGFKENNICIKKYFSDSTVNFISKKVTELLKGVDPQNRPIIVPNSTIYSVMNEIYRDYRPSTGDIYTKYTIPTNTESYVSDMINEVIQVITSDVRNNIDIEENNKKLTIWSTLLHGGNGLRQHPPIKLKHKRPASFQFHMRY